METHGSETGRRGNKKMNNEYIKSLSKPKLEEAYTNTLKFICEKMLYVEFLQWVRK